MTQYHDTSARRSILLDVRESIGELTIKGICALLILAAAFPQMASGASYATPRALLEEMERLQSSPCKLSCQIEVAGMYSAQFLESQRHAVMLGLQNEAYRRNNLLLFFGEEIPWAELEAISLEEFFARQLLHRERTTPSDLIMKETEIVSEKRLSDTEIQILVQHSGMEADPDYKEEGLMTFIREGNAWKIKH